MNPLRVYDYLELSRRHVLDAIRMIGPDDYLRPFAIGPGSLGAILTHIMISEWYYIERLEGRDVPPYAEWSIQSENPPAFGALERAWSDQAIRTREALKAVADWSARVEYEVTDDDNRRLHVTTDAADLFQQLALHEVHHRTQALNILRQLGVTLGDIDYNALMYTRRVV